MSEKLSLCPLCGDAADVLSGMGEFWVRCSDSDCFCSGPMRNQEHNAIAAWNRRSREEALEKAKNGAYSERNKLVAALSKIFPASLERHEGEVWEDDWRWVVFIDLPTGQVSWHLHDSELRQFDHLPNKCGRKWDGHTNEQKYERLAALPQDAAEKPEQERK